MQQCWCIVSKLIFFFEGTGTRVPISLQAGFRFIRQLGSCPLLRAKTNFIYKHITLSSEIFTSTNLKTQGIFCHGSIHYISARFQLIFKLHFNGSDLDRRVETEPRGRRGGRRQIHHESTNKFLLSLHTF
jgi:hypothetical protein